MAISKVRIRIFVHLRSEEWVIVSDAGYIQQVRFGDVHASDWRGNSPEPHKRWMTAKVPDTNYRLLAEFR